MDEHIEKKKKATKREKRKEKKKLQKQKKRDLKVAKKKKKSTHHEDDSETESDFEKSESESESSYESEINSDDLLEQEETEKALVKLQNKLLNEQHQQQKKEKKNNERKAGNTNTTPPNSNGWRQTERITLIETILELELKLGHPERTAESLESTNLGSLRAKLTKLENEFSNRELAVRKIVVAASTLGYIADSTELMKRTEGALLQKLKKLKQGGDLSDLPGKYKLSKEEISQQRKEKEKEWMNGILTAERKSALESKKNGDGEKDKEKLKEKLKEKEKEKEKEMEVDETKAHALLADQIVQNWDNLFDLDSKRKKKNQQQPHQQTPLSEKGKK